MKKKRLIDSINEKKEIEKFEKDLKDSDIKQKQNKLKKMNINDFTRIIERIKNFRNSRYKKKINLSKNRDNIYSVDFIDNTNNKLFNSNKNYLHNNYSLFNHKKNNSLINSFNNSKIYKYYINSFIMPPNPYESVIKAREYTFFNE